MHVHNPTSQSRLCPGLGANLEPFEVREVPDGFKKCSECRCVVSGEKASKTKAAEAE